MKHQTGRLKGAMQISKKLFLAALICMSGHGTIQAVPITYEFSAVGSGTLGRDSFSDAAFTIVATGDTSQIREPSPGIFALSDMTATVSVSGLPTATFDIATGNVDNQGLSRVGFSSSNQNLAILFENNPDFVTYDLSSSIGPVSGTPVFNNGADFGTSGGEFSLTSVGTVTFEAFTAVPDQTGTLGLLVLALGGCFWWKHKFTHASPCAFDD